MPVRNRSPVRCPLIQHTPLPSPLPPLSIWETGTRSGLSKCSLNQGSQDREGEGERERERETGREKKRPGWHRFLCCHQICASVKKVGIVGSAWGPCQSPLCAGRQRGAPPLGKALWRAALHKGVPVQSGGRSWAPSPGAPHTALSLWRGQARLRPSGCVS